jgi:hypothetical protein
MGPHLHKSIINRLDRTKNSTSPPFLTYDWRLGISMKIWAIYVFSVFLVFNLIRPLTSASTTYHYSTLYHHETLTPDIILNRGTNGTVYIISSNKTWAEVNVTGNLTETYYEYMLNITNLSNNINYTAKLENATIDGIGRLTNFTAYFHDGTTSRQIEISNGTVTQSSGSWCSIATSTTIYISIAIKVSTSSISTVDLRLHVVKSDTTSPEIIQTVRIKIN